MSTIWWNTPHLNNVMLFLLRMSPQFFRYTSPKKYCVHNFIDQCLANGIDCLDKRVTVSGVCYTATIYVYDRQPTSDPSGPLRVASGAIALQKFYHLCRTHPSSWPYQATNKHCDTRRRYARPWGKPYGPVQLTSEPAPTRTVQASGPPVCCDALFALSKVCVRGRLTAFRKSVISYTHTVPPAGQHYYSVRDRLDSVGGYDGIQWRGVL